MRERVEDGMERKVSLPDRQVRKPPRNTLKFMLSIIFLINLAPFTLEGEVNP